MENKIRIKAIVNISSDGYAADINGGLSWHHQFWDIEMADHYYVLIKSCGSLLLGRKTFETLSSPARIEKISRVDIPLWDLFANQTKIVCTKTPPRFNDGAIERYISNPIDMVKAGDLGNGSDVMIMGSLSILDQLLKVNLITEYYVFVHPLALMNGTYRLVLPLTKQLFSITEFSSGVKLCCHL